jgi:hypothetical protein
MKKFEFRLSSVLRVYELKLELEKAKLSQALADEQEILDCIRKRADEVRQQNEAIREVIELRSGDLRALSAYNLSAQTQNVAWHEDLGRVRQLIRLLREAVLREERKVKLVSKLKQKKLFEWERTLNQQFEKESQEVWLAIHGRNFVEKPSSDENSPSGNVPRSYGRRCIPPANPWAKPV